MKKLLHYFVISLLFVVFLGCSDESMNSSDSESLSLFKAGTSFQAPNLFDKDGNLCINVNSPYDQVGKPMQLWMGVGNKKAGTLVGTATFLTNPERVKIDLTDSDGDGKPDMFPYVIEDLHIHFAADVSGIPHTKKGNPIPGKFEYNVDVDPYQTSMEIQVSFDAVGAIHLAVEKIGGIEGFNFYLPNNEVKMTVAASGTSYNKMLIEGGGFISDYDSGLGKGWYESWCFAADLSIAYKSYSAYLYSSYENIPEDVLTQANINSDNLDNANWLMNNYNVGDVIESNGEILGTLTVMDIQKAIWTLINNKQAPSLLVKFIVEEALTNGEGYIPGCDEKIIFLSVPTDPNMIVNAQLLIGQPLIAEIPVPCEDEGGTAWGDGYYGATFPGSKQWGTWFRYDANCVPN